MNDRTPAVHSRAVQPQATLRTPALEALRHRQFALCLGSGLISHSGQWMQAMTISVVVLQLTGLQTWLGIAALASQLPALVFGPLGGIIAERYPRKRILLLSMMVQTLTALTLTVMWQTGTMTAWRVLPVLVVAGAASAVFITAWQSFIPLLVPPSGLTSAFRLNSVQFTFSRALGPAIAGFVLELYGPGVAFLANALSFLVPILAVALSHPRSVEPNPPSSPLREFADGLRYARSHAGLWIPILTMGWIGLFAQSLHHLNAGVAHNVFEVGDLELGLMGSTFGGAALAMSVGIALIGDRIRRSSMAQVGLISYALGMAVVGATRTFDVGLIGYTIMGMAHVLVQVNIGTSLQVHVAERFRARVTSIYLTSIIVANPAGALIGGALGDWIDLQFTVRLFALMLGLYALSTRIFLRGLRELDDPD